VVLGLVGPIYKTGSYFIIGVCPIFIQVDLHGSFMYRPPEEWDHIGVVIKAVGEYELKPELFLVGEIGSNRLYYREYR